MGVRPGLTATWGEWEAAHRGLGLEPSGLWDEWGVETQV